MIERKEKNGKIIIYYVKKDYDDEKMLKLMNTMIKPKDIEFIIDHDADVYDINGTLLLRFRKNKLKNKNIKNFYDNVIDFATKSTSKNRGSTTGSKDKSVWTNPEVMSNIIGYFDKLSPIHKYLLKKRGQSLPKITVRETKFVQDYPDKYKKLIPLIKEIDYYYKKYIPDRYVKQKKKANQTPFRISSTAFTTITTNVNFQTSIHTDKGDDIEGFGNLAVIEHGKYTGGETCFPQYGIGVNVRNSDILYMDVHQPHANLPIKLETPDVKRLSIVCYLRTSIWKQTKGKTRKFMEYHNRTIRKIKTK